MSNFYLTSDWDLDITNRVRRVTKSPQVAQLVRSRLQTIKGEWYREGSVGVPWFDSVFVNNYDLPTIESYIAKTIVSTNGVKSLDSMSTQVDRAARRLTVTFAGTTDFGESFASTATI